MSDLKQNKTERGFCYFEFKDGYSAKCSLQESSAARFEDDCGNVSDGFIWLGMDEDYEGREAHTHVDKASGYKIGARMHLSQSDIKSLLPLLNYFAEHGELPETYIPFDNEDQS